MGPEPVNSTNEWVRRLKLDEFRLLNADWAGPVPTLIDAVMVFERDGVDRLAPLSFADWMDPVYYREVHPEYAGLSDADVYRRWLFTDCAQGWPSSPEAHLRMLGLALSVFPEAFDWRAYAQSRQIVENRWFALQHLVENGLEQRDRQWLGAPGAFHFAATVGQCMRGRDDGSAIIAFETARTLGDVGYATTHHLADAHFRRGEWGGAWHLFSEAAQHPEAGLWSFVNGARAASCLGRFRAAAELLEAGRAVVGFEPAWREAVHQLVERFFEARTRRARRLYAAAEGRPRADRLITWAAEQSGQLWDRLDPVGAGLPPASEGTVVILANFDIPACVEYRVEQKVEQLRRLGRPCVVYGLEQWESFTAALPGAAAAVIFRLPAWPTVSRALSAASRLGVPTFYDIDDLIFDSAEFPDAIETYGGQISEAGYEALLLGAPLFRQAISLCDYGIAPTAFLAERLQPLVRKKRAFVVPNGLDKRHETLGLPQSRPGPKPDASVVIFYASGTPAHTSDFNALAGPALVELLQADPNVQLSIVGHVVLSEAFDAVRDQVRWRPFVEDLGVLWGMLAEADINLAVLRSTPATDAKSEIKWLEAAVLGVPSIVSDTATYRDVLEDGVDGLLAATPEGWRTALNRMVADPELRRSMGRRAREKAACNYGQTATAQSLALALDAAEQRGAAERGGAARAKRVLLVGEGLLRGDRLSWETAVLEPSLLADFEIAVLTDDAGGADNSIRVEEHRGAPAVRLDLDGGGLGIRRAVGRLLGIRQPDLVHLTYSPRLAAPAAEACRMANIPYVLSGLEAASVGLLPTTNPGDEGTETLDPEERLVFAAMVRGAAHVLTRTIAAAEACREWGAQSVEVVLIAADPIARASSESGRVRLLCPHGDVESKALKKVEAALRRGRLPNLEFTLVDSSRDASEAEILTWGDTTVRRVGGGHNGAVERLLRTADVLLAPSSGARLDAFIEAALASGVWIVLGTEDANREFVHEGVNGFVLNGGGRELRDVLTMLNADPVRFRSSPRSPSPPISAEQQAAALLNVYRMAVGID